MPFTVTGNNFTPTSMVRCGIIVGHTDCVRLAHSSPSETAAWNAALPMTVSVVA